MSTERQKMLAGEMYDRFDPELVTGRARARDLCQQLNATRETEEVERRRILRDLFAKGGDSVWMQPPFYCPTTGPSYLYEHSAVCTRVLANRFGSHDR